MPRRGPTLVVLALVPLMALAGFFDGPTGLFMVAPFLALIGLLVFGLYPGERLIETLAESLRPGRRNRSVPPSLVELCLTAPGRLLLVGTPGSRAPPSFS